MSKKKLVTLDRKGRITIPKEAREELDLEEGAAFFLSWQRQKSELQLSRAIDEKEARALKTLKEHAEREYAAGNTKSFREYLKERNLE